MNFARARFAVACFVAFTFLLTSQGWGQQNRGEVDPRPCLSDILRTSSSYTNNIDYTNSWMDLVDETYFKQHKDEVNASAEKTLAWKAAASYEQFDEERRTYRHAQASQTSYNQSLQYVFNGMPDRAFATIDKCLETIAITRPNVYFSVSKSTSEEVQLRIYWVGLPGPKPTPFLVEGSNLQHARRTDATQISYVDRYSPFRNAAWSDAPDDGMLLRHGVTFSGTSMFTMTLKRESATSAVVGSLWGPNFDQVFFNIEPPAPPKTVTTKCSVSSKELKQSSDPNFYTIPFPPGGGENFPLDCWNLPTGKMARVTWQGTVLSPKFPSYNQGQLVDAQNPAVDYVANLVLLLRDAAGQQLVPNVQVLQSHSPAKDDHPASGTFSLPVPPSGAIVARLAANDSNKWPGYLGPISLSDDFRLTIEVTDK